MRKTWYALIAVAGVGVLAGDMSGTPAAGAGTLANSDAGSTAAASPQAEAASVTGEAPTTPAVWRHYMWQPWTRGRAGPRPYVYSDRFRGYGFPNWRRVPQRSAPPWSRPWAGPPTWRRDYGGNYGWRGYRGDGWVGPWRGNGRWVGAPPYDWRLR